MFVDGEWWMDVHLVGPSWPCPGTRLLREKTTTAVRCMMPDGSVCRGRSPTIN
jgi:hypothetical protein